MHTVVAFVCSAIILTYFLTSVDIRSLWEYPHQKFLSLPAVEILLGAQLLESSASQPDQSLL